MVVFALTLVRHGETAHNKENVIQGQMDVPLSQTGLQQAEMLGCHLQYQQYSHVYASDLTRAIQTAESIIRQNKSFKSILLNDRRLRERKFGMVEGKSFRFLLEAAEKANQKVGQYSPPGGETIQQVHERAVSFFHDLCEMVKEHSSKLESQNESDKISTNGSPLTENGKQSGQKRKCEYNEAEKLQKVDCQNGSPCKVYVKGTQDEEESKSFACPSSNSTIDDDDDDEDDDDNDEDDDDDDSSAEIPTDYCGALENFSDKGQFSIMFTDDVIRSQIMSSSSDLPNIECPNVSLSPLVDQNLVTSSLLSNPSSHESAQSNSHHERRHSECSSCDDADGDPIIIANILVVSHGGWLRELFRYFVEDLECSVPGGKKQALRISPNAGLSKFTVSLEESGGYPKIICHQIHDKQHLSVTTYADNTLNPDEIAL